MALLVWHRLGSWLIGQRIWLEQETFSYPKPVHSAVAAHLHISPQTLRRHLREEGSSFQELKDQLRRDIAIYHLGRADLLLQQIAEQLGFSEPSAFHRAFKKLDGADAWGLSGAGALIQGLRSSPHPTPPETSDRP